ncbi:hypothetical protein JK386_04270 [Nocardioides sp. zg-536]|uniref:Uncharacterized protein n=1 Tax=Nocardioides faecalis TaxID=2803858 RepID=A0A938XZJ3_9ACTN|nr:hypothetical protein [Nocardioides faecalis]MBM9459106.1 hypothetical protein [Nocardioides faecalis]QVI57364.1 hypothetical protein KG111_09530 [Nocardioides faecalis]
MTLIWATRGKTWGFRFVRDGGFADPLPPYERAFAGVGVGPRAFQRCGPTVAVRFPDPLGRKDAAGRPIPHELVLFPPQSADINNVEDALEVVWPLLAEEYASIWDPTPN